MTNSGTNSRTHSRTHSNSLDAVDTSATHNTTERGKQDLHKEQTRRIIILGIGLPRASSNLQSSGGKGSTALNQANLRTDTLCVRYTHSICSAAVCASKEVRKWFYCCRTAAGHTGNPKALARPVLYAAAVVLESTSMWLH